MKSKHHSCFWKCSQNKMHKLLLHWWLFHKARESNKRWNIKTYNIKCKNERERETHTHPTGVRLVTTKAYFGKVTAKAYFGKVFFVKITGTETSWSGATRTHLHMHTHRYTHRYTHKYTHKNTHTHTYLPISPVFAAEDRKFYLYMAVFKCSFSHN